MVYRLYVCIFMYRFQHNGSRFDSSKIFYRSQNIRFFFFSISSTKSLPRTKLSINFDVFFSLAPFSISHLNLVRSIDFVKTIIIIQKGDESYFFFALDAVKSFFRQNLYCHDC